MVGGSKEKLSGILVKKQEVKKIGLEIKRLNQEYDTACQDQKALESQVWSIENDLQKLQTQMNTAGHHQVEAEKDLYKATEDLKHAQRHLEIVQLEQERLLGEESDIDEEMTQYNEAVSVVENQVKNAQETVSEKLEQIAAVSSEMEAFDQKIVDLKLQLTSLSAKLENSNNTLKRLKEFQNDGIQQIEQLSRDISQKKQKRITCKQKIEEYEQKMRRIIPPSTQSSEKVTVSYRIYRPVGMKLCKKFACLNLNNQSGALNGKISPGGWKKAITVPCRYLSRNSKIWKILRTDP